MKRRYHGSRVSKTNRPKHFAALLALVLILVCTVGGTVAYLVAHTDPVTNTFTPGEVSCQVKEEFNEKTKTKAVIQNTGNVPAYIRVAVVANTIDAQGNITGMADLSQVDWLNEANWTEGNDGFYYYKGVVQPGEKTDNLLKNGIDLDGIQVTILSGAIQSMPDAAVEEAWNMSYNSGNWTADTGSN